MKCNMIIVDYEALISKIRKSAKKPKNINRFYKTRDVNGRPLK